MPGERLLCFGLTRKMELGMVPATLFEIANALALSGWAALIVGTFTDHRWLRSRVAGRLVPIALSIFYTAIILTAWPGSRGGYDSLEAVSRLFEDPLMLLAGWAHYLAFDLLVGSWIADEVERRGLTRWLLLPALPLTFLFGPIGLLTFAVGAALLRPAQRDA
jgi:hypothetical protein